MCILQRQKVIKNIVEDLSAAFGEWEATPSETSSAAKSLAHLTGAAYEVGVMIASQASAYRFNWRSAVDHKERGGAEKFVIFPEFVKITDECGLLIDRPQVLMPAEKVRLRNGSGRV